MFNYTVFRSFSRVFENTERASERRRVKGNNTVCEIITQDRPGGENAYIYILFSVGCVLLGKRVFRAKWRCYRAHIHGSRERGGVSLAPLCIALTRNENIFVPIGDLISGGQMRHLRCSRCGN